MLRSGGAGLAGAVGAGRRHGHPCLTDEGKGCFIIRHADGNGIKPCGDRIGHSGGAVEDDGQRPRPESIHQRSCGIRDACPKLLHIVLFRHMQNKRIIGRASLRLEDAFHRFPVKAVRPKAVHRFRGERHKSPRPEDAAPKACAVFLLCHCVCKLGLHKSPPFFTPDFPPSAALCAPQGSAPRSARPYPRP